MQNPFIELREHMDQRLDALARDLRIIASSSKSAERKRLVGPAEAAKYVNLAKQTVYKKCHLREMPHSKVGGRLLFDLDHLDAWIASGRRATAAEVAEERMSGKNEKAQRA